MIYGIVKKTALACLFAAGLLLLLAACNKPPPSPPNIVFVLLDAARADHFSSYGYKRNTTPAMDAIGQKGALFLKNFVPETETYAVLPLIFSSRYFSRPIFQMESWEWGIRKESPRTIFQDYDAEQILLPAALSTAGYRTVMFHNHPWFVDGTDFVGAFDESHLFPTPDLGPVDNMMVDAILDWVGRHRNNKFFVYYHVMSPHQPYPPKPEDRLFIRPEETTALTATREKFKNRMGGSTEGWTEDELDYFRVMYDSNLAHSDSSIGRLYAGLADLGLTDNTLFIITADHGELLGQHEGLIHGDFPPWDASTHVPLIMVWPAHIPAGVQVTGLTTSVDIFPTIIDLAGVQLPSGKSLDGISLRGLLDDPGAGRDAVYIKNAVRTSWYKYMIDKDFFFDLAKDPGEITNVAASQPDSLKQRLKSDYEQFMKPYRERYRAAARTQAPPFRFHFPINEFDVSPEGAWRRIDDDRPVPESLPDDSEAAWHLNMSSRQGYLLCLPGAGDPPPLTLSCRLPNGTYRVSLLIDFFTCKDLLLKTNLYGLMGLLRSRFNQDDVPNSPWAITTVGAESIPDYYLDYYKISVENERFWLELDFRPDPPVPFLIRHVRFDPLPEGEGGPAVLDQKELKERLNGLKSLGYIQ